MQLPLTPAPAEAPQAVRDLLTFAREVMAPTQPQRLFACDASELPDPAGYTYCQAWIKDLECIAVSSGVEWINTATGGTI